MYPKTILNFLLSVPVGNKINEIDDITVTSWLHSPLIGLDPSRSLWALIG